jgi:2,4-dienoyl-CoA reductase-like NADH-dependent reductase (Old Yellow Enzyme family)
MSVLFSPFALRSVTFKNRVFMSPMCQYSAIDGAPQDWHLVHLTTRALGGAAMIMTEATAVCPQGRISAWDTGIWNDAQVASWSPIVASIKRHGAVAAIQLAHAGRKASISPPWLGGKCVPVAEGGWEVSAPSAIAFSDQSPLPRAMTDQQLDELIGYFEQGARRSLQAGFEVIELHMAHGYLLHEFLSPLSNHRTDAWGGDLQGRMRLPLRVVEAVRKVLPDEVPLMVRISSTDWVQGGWDLSSSIELAVRMKALGVDLIDCSSAGLVTHAKVPIGPGYQTPFASEIRQRASIATGAVGMITSPVQAEHIVSTGQADAVFLGRQLLRDPYFPLRAARELGAQVSWPDQYERARW